MPWHGMVQAGALMGSCSNLVVLAAGEVGEGVNGAACGGEEGGTAGERSKILIGMVPLCGGARPHRVEKHGRSREHTHPPHNTRPCQALPACLMQWETYMGKQGVSKRVS